MGYHGILAPAIRTAQQGTSSGAAVRAPAYIAVAQPPTHEHPARHEGQLVTGKMPWGMAGAYTLACNWSRLNDSDARWVVGGDWNLTSDTLDGLAWSDQLRAAFIMPSEVARHSANATGG
eukprot:3477707-Pyramimonas_sp.AAC.1